jgi:ribosomal protein L11 methyltransferase
MGFGTGHHASTRLCLALIQGIRLTGASVLDAGTGSGVLAIASLALGAAAVLAVDYDGDALESARENVALNDATSHITLRQLDLAAVGPERAVDELGGMFGVITGNLTGAVIERILPVLAAVLLPSGFVILGGIMRDEVDRLVEAAERAGLTLARRSDEDEWVGLAMRSGPAPDGPAGR